MRLLCCLVLSCAFAAQGSALSLFNFSFPGTPGSLLASAQPPGVNGAPLAPYVSDFFLSPGISRSGGNIEHLAVQGFSTGGIDFGRYVSFTIDSSLGTNIKVGRLDFDIGRVANGPQLLDVAAFIHTTSGTFLWAVETFAVPAGGGFTAESFNFANIFLDGDIPNQAIEFRFYGYGANTATGNLRLDNVNTFGDVLVAVPEPATIFGGLLAVGVAGAAWVRRSGRKLVC